jgi:hypothetical protein
LLACGAEAPPLEELELRDALQAQPGVVAAMTLGARRDLARRLADESELFRTELVAGDADVWQAWPEEQIRVADSFLEDRGEDAMVLSVVHLGDHEGELESWALDGHVLDGIQSVGPELPLLEGLVAEETEALEAAALEGRAGAIVQDIVDESGASRLERVEGWPVGVVAIGDFVFVNGAWLVAMSPGARIAADAPSRAHVRRERTVRRLAPRDARAPSPRESAGAARPQAADVIVSSIVTARVARDACDDCDEACEDACDDACDDVCDDTCNDDDGTAGAAGTSDTTSTGGTTDSGGTGGGGSSGCDSCGDGGGSDSSGLCTVHGRRRRGTSAGWLLAPLLGLFLSSRRKR